MQRAWQVSGGPGSRRNGHQRAPGGMIQGSLNLADPSHISDATRYLQYLGKLPNAESLGAMGYNEVCICAALMRYGFR